MRRARLVLAANTFLDSIRPRLRPASMADVSARMQEIFEFEFFLRVIVARYVRACGRLKIDSNRVRAKWGPQERQRRTRLELAVHLEIEGFYLFSKILLDRSACLLGFLFGGARNLSLGSHGEMIKNIERYRKVKYLSPDIDRLINQALPLDAFINEYRDKVIVHPYPSGLLRGLTHVSGTQRVSQFRMGISRTRAGVKFVESKSYLPDKLIPAVREYLCELFVYLHRNRALISLRH